MFKQPKANHVEMSWKCVKIRYKLFTICFCFPQFHFRIDFRCVFCRSFACKIFGYIRFALHLTYLTMNGVHCGVNWIYKRCNVFYVVARRYVRKNLLEQHTQNRKAKPFLYHVVKTMAFHIWTAIRSTISKTSAKRIMMQLAKSILSWCSTFS